MAYTTAAVRSLTCNFFKIDVQGFEYEVLLGVKEFLKEATKGNIKLEFEWDPYFTRQRNITKCMILDLLIEVGFSKAEPSFENWSDTISQKY